MLILIAVFVSAFALIATQLNARGKAVFVITALICAGLGYLVATSLLGFEASSYRGPNWFLFAFLEFVAIVIAGGVAMGGFSKEPFDDNYLTDEELEELKGDDGKLY